MKRIIVQKATDFWPTYDPKKWVAFEEGKNPSEGSTGSTFGLAAMALAANVADESEIPPMQVRITVTLNRPRDAVLMVWKFFLAFLKLLFGEKQIRISMDPLSMFVDKVQR
ncbi:MAG: hypothetical protein HYW65_02915 [Candidatus Liptonbacteria bacterium]|nr:hypothetical protein [Candidatus Liptonbacteria bacterium]